LGFHRSVSGEHCISQHRGFSPSPYLFVIEQRPRRRGDGMKRPRKDREAQGQWGNGRSQNCLYTTTTTAGRRRTDDGFTKRKLKCCSLLGQFHLLDQAPSPPFFLYFYFSFYHSFSSERTTCTIPISQSFFLSLCVCLYESLGGNSWRGFSIRFDSISSPPFVFHHCMSVLSCLVVSK